MEITQVSLADIVPYENNPRRNDNAVDIVAKSIKEFGFLVPIILDDKNYIVAGHTRWKASKKLGLNEVPCIYAEGLTNAQIKAFRIMDNKSSEYAEWDIDLLNQELKELKSLNFDVELTGFSNLELDMVNKEYSNKNKEINSNELTSNLNHKCPKCGFEFEDDKL